MVWGQGVGAGYGEMVLEEGVRGWCAGMVLGEGVGEGVGGWGGVGCRAVRMG